MAVDRRRHADPVGQSGRRPRVRRRQAAPSPKKVSDRPTGTGGRSRGSRPAARGRRHPAGAPAGIWRRARQACDLRLLAVRLSRRQPRRSDRRRQHRADRAATGADAADTRCSQPPRHPSLPTRAILSGPIAAERPVMPVDRATSRRNRLPMTSSPHNRAKRPPGLRCSMRLPNLPLPMSRPPSKPFRRATGPSARAIPGPRSVCRPAGAAAACRCASPGRWIGRAASRSAPTNFSGLIGPRTTAAFGRPWREIAEIFGLDPAGRMMQAFATRRHLERHHAELAGRRRRHLARRTVRPAGVRCGAEFHRLSRLRRLPRFRRHRAARRPASGGIVRRDGDAARTARCAI